MSITGRAPRLLFIDSGLGGLTVLRAARAAVPEADVLFIADDAGFPYGLKSEAVL
ncbi:MAG: glutamate racemase, partial [Rhodomicrobium sp.]